MSKHTPGPWSTDEKDHTEPYMDIVIRSGKRNIAILWIDDAPDAEYNAEQKANALHIVHCVNTYPALLEALEKVEWVYTDYGCDLCPWCGAYPGFGHAPDCIRQTALKLARGEG